MPGNDRDTCTDAHRQFARDYQAEAEKEAIAGNVEKAEEYMRSSNEHDQIANDREHYASHTRSADADPYK